jgi:hypothetical protein
VPKSRRRRRAISGVSLVIALTVVLGLYLAFQRVTPLLKGSACEVQGGKEVTGDGQVITLAPAQAGIAATIAGVAQREALPSRAVTVAYAAALQESKLQNLTYGDRDSVGIFQQRPSQGWGKPKQIENPVYATSRFFGALTKIPGYQRLPVYQAAQAVQHSADGTAYQQYQLLAAHMARAFTGQVPHAVSCWYSQKISGKAQLDAAELGLTQTFGAHVARVTADARRSVRVGSPRDGWAVAAWLVSHAPQYRIDEVQYAGYRWSAANSTRGWARSVSPTPPESVELG